MANKEQVEMLLRSVEEWNEWRDGNPSIKPDLIGAGLRGATLIRASLAGAVFTYADLRGADLTDATLAGATLTYADLTGADLTAVNLSNGILINTSLPYADLTAANLVGGTLRSTDLTSATLVDTALRDADLTDAQFRNTVLGRLDLSEVLGLTKVKHKGPSVVDHETIHLSKGQIPEVFLRGCGLDETYIQYCKSLVEKPFEFFSCFISYSHADKSFARRLHDQLQARGIRCWLDEHQILPGDEIYDAVDRGIRLWDKVLLCCSEASLSSWWVGNELSAALKKERQLRESTGEKKLAIIPLNLDGALFGWKDGKAPMLQERLAPEFVGWEKDNAIFEREFERVVQALRADDGAREAPPTSLL